MTVLDASAVLALIQSEPGADVVAARLPGARLSAANLAEVIGKMSDAGVDVGGLRFLLVSANVRIEPVLEEDAELAGALRGVPGGRALSLADRCCLALAMRTEPATVLTADRVWKKLQLPVTVELIR